MSWAEVRVVEGRPLSWIVFNRPDRLNAMSSSMLSEARRALRELESRRGVHFIAFRGEGRAFSAGADLRELASAGGAGEASRLFEELAGFIDDLLNTRLVTIAAVHGVAAGGGAEVLWAFDLVVVSRDARILWPEGRWGLVAPALTTIGPAVLGPGRAAALALTTGEMTGEEAYRLGVASALAEDASKLQEAVEGLVARVMENAPQSVAASVRLLREWKRRTLLPLGAEALVSLSRTETAREAARHFAREKRPPRHEWPS